MKQIKATYTVLIRISCIVVLLSAAFVSKLNAQQTPLYSQYLFNMTTINPSYAGDTSIAGYNLLFRRQWMGIQSSTKKAPITMAFTYNSRRSDSGRIGWGVQLYNDRIGVENTTGLQAFYSYRIPFEQSQLTLGLSGGVINYKADFRNVTTTEANDPAFMKVISGWLPSAGAGLLFERKSWWLSFSVPALLKTKLNAQGKADVSSFGSDNHYYLGTGFHIRTEEELVVSPTILLKAVSGAPLQVDFNLTADFDDLITVGLSYRTGDSYVGMAQLRLTPEIRFGYAYDYMTVLSAYTRSAHELMFRFKPKKKQEEKRIELQ